MPASQLHLAADTPLGANLIPDGATFRVWAPRAQAVFISLNPNPAATGAPGEANRLVPDAHGFWAGFFPGVEDGDAYKFYVIGAGSQTFNRGRNARDFFCRKRRHTCPAAQLGACVAKVNRLLAARNCPPLTHAQLAIQRNQF